MGKQKMVEIEKKEEEIKIKEDVIEVKASEKKLPI